MAHPMGWGMLPSVVKNTAPNGDATMNDATLSFFRSLADQMAGPEPRTWEWVGPHMSQRMFGITEKRAREYAARHGGTAREMPKGGAR